MQLGPSGVVVPQVEFGGQAARGTPASTGGAVAASPASVAGGVAPSEAGPASAPNWHTATHVPASPVFSTVNPGCGAPDWSVIVLGCPVSHAYPAGQAIPPTVQNWVQYPAAGEFGVSKQLQARLRASAVVQALPSCFVGLCKAVTQRPSFCWQWLPPGQSASAAQPPWQTPTADTAFVVGSTPKPARVQAFLPGQPVGGLPSTGMVHWGKQKPDVPVPVGKQTPGAVEVSEGPSQ
jgi:hypothetical protein